MTLRLDNSSPKYELAEATLAAIVKHGFYLTHAAVHALPVETVGSHHDDQKNDSDCRVNGKTYSNARTSS